MRSRQRSCNGSERCVCLFRICLRLFFRPQLLKQERLKVLLVLHCLLRRLGTRRRVLLSCCQLLCRPRLVFGVQPLQRTVQRCRGDGRRQAVQGGGVQQLHMRIQRHPRAVRLRQEEPGGLGCGAHKRPAVRGVASRS